MNEQNDDMSRSSEQQPVASKEKYGQLPANNKLRRIMLGVIAPIGAAVFANEARAASADHRPEPDARSVNWIAPETKTEEEQLNDAGLTLNGSASNGIDNSAVIDGVEQQVDVENVQGRTLFFDEIVVGPEDSTGLHALWSRPELPNVFQQTYDVILGETLIDTRLRDSQGIEYPLSSLGINGESNLSAHLASLLLDVQATQSTGEHGPQIQFIVDKSTGQIRVELLLKMADTSIYTASNGVVLEFPAGSYLTYVRANGGALQQQRLLLQPGEQMVTVTMDDDLRQRLVAAGANAADLPENGREIPLAINDQRQPIRLFTADLIGGEALTANLPESTANKAELMMVRARDGFANLRSGPGTNFNDVGDLQDTIAILNTTEGAVSATPIPATPVPPTAMTGEAFTAQLSQIPGWTSEFNVVPDASGTFFIVTNPNATDQFDSWIPVIIGTSNTTSLDLNNLAFVAVDVSDVVPQETATDTQTGVLFNIQSTPAANNSAEAVQAVLGDATVIPEGVEIVDSAAITTLVNENTPAAFFNTYGSEIGNTILLDVQNGAYRRINSETGQTEFWRPGMTEDPNDTEGGWYTTAASFTTPTTNTTITIEFNGRDGYTTGLGRTYRNAVFTPEFLSRIDNWIMQEAENLTGKTVVIDIATGIVSRENARERGYSETMTWQGSSNIITGWGAIGRVGNSIVVPAYVRGAGEFFSPEEEADESLFSTILHDALRKAAGRSFQGASAQRSFDLLLPRFFPNVGYTEGDQLIDLSE